MIARLMKTSTVVASTTLILVLASCSDTQHTHPGTPAPAVDVTRAPERVSWTTLSSGLAYPVSKVSGPQEMSPVPHRFEHSPQGAVLAAMTAHVFMAGAGDDLWPEVSRILLESGRGRDQWAQARALMSVTGTLADPPVFRGFKIVDYTHNSAVIDIAVDYPSHGLAMLPVQLSYSTGDWRVVVPTQEQAPDLTPVTDDTLRDKFTIFTPNDHAKEQHP